MSDSQHFYRCRVTAGLAHGKLRIGRKSFDVYVDEKSIDVYTIRLAANDLGKINLDCKKNWVLQHFGEITRVTPEWLLNHGDDFVQLGLRRGVDLTPPPHTGNAIHSIFSIRSFGRRLTAYPELLLGVTSVVLLVLLTIPGFGDHLGTAPRIRQGTQTLVQEAHKVFRALLR